MWLVFLSFMWSVRGNKLEQGMCLPREELSSTGRGSRQGSPRESLRTPSPTVTYVEGRGEVRFTRKHLHMEAMILQSASRPGPRGPGGGGGVLVRVGRGNDGMSSTPAIVRVSVCGQPSSSSQNFPFLCLFPLGPRELHGGSLLLSPPK